jgi:hypothetical protein
MDDREQGKSLLFDRDPAMIKNRSQPQTRNT